MNMSFSLFIFIHLIFYSKLNKYRHITSLEFARELKISKSISSRPPESSNTPQFGQKFQQYYASNWNLLW